MSAQEELELEADAAQEAMLDSWRALQRWKYLDAFSSDGDRLEAARQKASLEAELAFHAHRFCDALHTLGGEGLGLSAEVIPFPGKAGGYDGS